MELKDFKKGLSYNSKEIDSAVVEYDEENESNEVTQTLIGENHIGEFFATLNSSENKVVSFVLTGWNGSRGNIYECIYTDFLS